MFTSIIGNNFLKQYNSRNQTRHSAQEYFEKIFLPLFYDHPKYMMSAALNSPLINPPIAFTRGDYPTKENRSLRIGKTIEKIITSESLESSIAIGFPSAFDTPYSSQVTSLRNGLDKDDAFLSWIGAATGIMVSGGYQLFIISEQLTEIIEEGWTVYRNLLNNETLNFKPNQCNTFLGQWLVWRLDKRYSAGQTTSRIASIAVPKDNFLEFPTVGWVRVLFAVQSILSNPKVMIYIAKFGQLNSTLGMIPFYTSSTERIITFYRKLFNSPTIDSDIKRMQQLYETKLSLERTIQLGTIGLRALEPKNLLDGNKTASADNDSDQKIKFFTYITWIVAMIDNDKIWDLAQNCADILKVFSDSDKKASTSLTNRVDIFLNSKNKRDFISNLNELIESLKYEQEGIKEKIALLDTIVKEVHYMPEINLGYFMQLIKYHYLRLRNKYPI